MQDVAFVEVGAKRVFTVFTEPEQSQRKLVIMAHGFRGNSIGPARTFVNFERLLLADGFSCLRFDQPGSGNSEGDFSQSSFDTWIETIVYFASYYLDAGYRIALLGQSMGATATMVAAARPELRERVPCVLLWVPDPKSTFEDESSEFGEEAGQRYPTRFWREARQSGFMQSLKAYPGGIHLVYGEDDVYVGPGLRRQAIKAVLRKGQPHLVLAGQGHSSWDYEAAQHVFEEQRTFLARYF